MTQAATLAQLALPAYAAKITGWSFAGPPVWSRVTRTYRICPSNSSAVDKTTLLENPKPTMQSAKVPTATSNVRPARLKGER